MRSKFLVFSAIFILCEIFCSSAFSANWSSPVGGHLGAWKAMWRVDLNKGGLGKKLPNPITRQGREKLREIHTFIDCHDGNHVGSGKYKRNGITHNPIYVAAYFNNLYGFNYQAVFNATAIHVILDMATGKSDDGVNGNSKTSKRSKESQRLWDKMVKGERIDLPDWATKTGQNTRGYDPKDVENQAKKKAEYDKTTRNKVKTASSNGKSGQIDELKGSSSDKKLNLKSSNEKNINRLIKSLGGASKVIPKVVNGVQVLIVFYETGKTALWYWDTGNINLKELAENAGGAVGGSLGARAGSKLGCVIGGAIAGACGGAKIGLTAGASFGTFATPGAGTAIGGVAGGVIGGITGAFAGGYGGLKAGEYVGRKTFDYLIPVESEKLLTDIHYKLRNKAKEYLSLQTTSELSQAMEGTHT